MSLAEFASRVQAHHPEARAGTRLYLQAPLDAALHADVDLSCEPFSLLGDAGDCTPPPHATAEDGNGAAGTAERRLAGTLSQAARLWISPGGSVSPLHFDASPSFLTQVRWPSSRNSARRLIVSQTA